MHTTPQANRKHIALFGKRNAGKSSLINAIIGQEISLVSDVKGTTTDPVSKAMELLPFGPVVFIDTAGLDDEGELGALRVERSMKILQRTDLALYIVDPGEHDAENYTKLKTEFKRFNIPHLSVINKADAYSEEELQAVKSIYDGAHVVSALTEDGVIDLKSEIIAALQTQDEELPIVGDLLPYGSTVVMVVPIDSEAPKGRIILPQVQLIRDCLDHGIKCHVLRDTELAEGLKELKKVDLVVTDSQAFKQVAEIVPRDVKLTGFSTLFARHKGDIDAFIDGVRFIEELTEDSRILISESCTHNTSHEDIGRVKIPRLLEKYTGKKLNFTFKMGHDFPSSIEDFDFIIHCGSCMLNRKTMLSRVAISQEKTIPITN
ncbi:MAG: [FeFe] hydrogenase H-cluster maturation GTPase HydF, partial [Clostridia bacterium]|nr:[FeFe] hydrogenase H-cluster maturation GTPase HydF [Clostridia bacterium]